MSTRSADPEIYLHHLDGSPETRFTDTPGQDDPADWSPDGRKLLFVSERGGGESRMYVADRDGSGVRRVLDQPVTGTGVRWSPDGERISYVVESEAGWHLHPSGEQISNVALRV